MSEWRSDKSRRLGECDKYLRLISKRRGGIETAHERHYRRPMKEQRPVTSGWQPCPHCYAHGWITRAVAVRDERVTQVWRCGNCRHEWASDASAATTEPLARTSRSKERLSHGGRP